MGVLPSAAHGPGESSAKAPTYQAIHQQLTQEYPPPSLLADSSNNVVYFPQRASRYLAHPAGEVTQNLTKLVRQELQMELLATFSQACKTQAAVRSKSVWVRFNGESAPVVLRVKPSLHPDQEGFVLVVFEEQAVTAADHATEQPPRDAGKEGAGQNAAASDDRLRVELDRTRAQLRAIIEQQDADQQEVKAGNEELQSANEELRSTLEELESMNEELQTLNQENRHKAEELGQLADDLLTMARTTDALATTKRPDGGQRPA
jgi:two-component system CheB/CheR fusion protein